MVFQAEDGPGGGSTWAGEDHADGNQTKPGSVFVYVKTDNIDAIRAQVIALGARALAPRKELLGTNGLAIFRDPAGNEIGCSAAVNGQG